MMQRARDRKALRFAERHREQDHDDRQAIAQTTPRREVLQALAGGLDSKAIADRLHISVRTEQNHIANVPAKLNVHSRRDQIASGGQLITRFPRPPSPAPGTSG